MTYHHGITVTEAGSGGRAVTTVATAVIGFVATGPHADASVFPLNRAVVITDPAAAIEKAGEDGTLRHVLRAIADQVDRAVIVVVRVTEGADAAATTTALIGGVVGGQKTGMQALLAAEAQLGVKPRIIGAPGLDTQAVTAALVVVAKKLRAMVYAAAIGADDVACIAYRANFAARELMLITPDFRAFDVVGGQTATSWAAARALGLRARIDAEQGWHKTLSNVAVQGVTGMTRDVDFDIQDPATAANLLNEAEITTIVRTPGGGGLRFWGSRTCSDAEDFAFESATRTAQVLMDTIAQGLVWAIDKPLRPSLVKDILEEINAELRRLKREGRILGGQARFDEDLNPATELAAGKLAISYDFTPVPPLEHLLLSQVITDTYLADFGAAVDA